MLVVLGAYGFYEFEGRAPIPPHSSPRLIESVRIVYRKTRFHHFAIVDHSPALHNAQLFSMRRAVDVHEQSGVLADGVDHQRIPIIMPDRLADGTPPKRFVVIAFDNMDKAKAWSTSPSQK